MAVGRAKVGQFPAVCGALCVEVPQLIDRSFVTQISNIEGMVFKDAAAGDEGGKAASGEGAAAEAGDEKSIAGLVVVYNFKVGVFYLFEESVAQNSTAKFLEGS